MKMQAIRRRALFFSMSAASLACTHPAAAQPAAPVTVSGWTIRDLRGFCSAESRQNGLSAEIVLLPGSNDTTMLLRHASWSALRERRGDAASLRFSNGRTHDAGITAGRRTGAGDDRVTTVNVSYSRTLLEDFARAHRVDVSIGGAPAGTLSLRGTSAVVARLRSCTAASARRHPVPAMPPPLLRPQAPAEEPPGARPPIAISGPITNDDYPAAAIRAGEQGSVMVRLTVSADGRVTACSIEESSGSAILDSTTCILSQRRFRFRPAIDSNGTPVAGTVTRRVIWRLPAPPPPPQPQVPVPPK
jgi:TonB family protein